MDFKLANSLVVAFASGCYFVYITVSKLRYDMLQYCTAEEYGVRVWSQISKRKISVGASRLEIHEHNLKIGRPGTTRNIIDILQFSVRYVIPDNFRYGMM